MKLHSGWVFLALSAATSALAIAACQSNSQSTGAAGAGGSGGASGSGASTTTGSMTGSTSSGTGGATTTSGTGGNTGCVSAMDATIGDITSGKFGSASMTSPMVSIKGVVAMSQKFLASKSKSTGSCLWGVFVSAPGLTETAAGSGLLVLSYGTNATTNDAGQTYCPELDAGGTGDAIPDDVKPGDTLDLIGTPDYFLLKNCGTMAGDSQVKQYQLAKVCQATKTGTAAAPKAHVLTSTEIAQLSSPTDQMFHDQWGGVKVAMQSVHAATNPVVGMYGIVSLTEGNVQVTDSIYYRGYEKTQICHAGPVFTAAASPPYYTFTNVEGFSYLDFCTWSLGVNDKCADFAPASEDCAGMTSCTP